VSAARVGRYRIVRLIREGGQGSVYLGYDARLQRRVAVKLYRLPAERSARRRVLTEARVIAGIDSPRVVRVYDVISAGEHLALIMEYVPGCDLEELLQQGPLPLTALLRLGVDISAALAAVRQRRLVHGDLKASNVLVAENGQALLTDFGIAGSEGRGDKRAGGWLGSIAALSPEQLRGEALDVRSDLFALGCLLYRMVAQCHPFLNRGELDTECLLHQPHPPLPAALADGTPVPSGLRDLVDRLLAKEPVGRPDNTHRVRQILRDLLRQQPQSTAHAPLAGVRSLQRRESCDDLPPPIPRTFQRQSRSQLGDWRGWSELDLHALLRLARRPRVQLGVLLLTGTVAALVLLSFPRPRHIALQPPELAVARQVELPEGLSLDWLHTQVCTAATSVDRRLRFHDAPTACSRADRGPAVSQEAPPPDEHLQLALRCERQLCLVGLTRGQGEDESYRQAVLMPDMPLAQWSAVIARLARESYRGAPGG
jgi:serine/threonine protein kinase